MTNPIESVVSEALDHAADHSGQSGMRKLVRPKLPPSAAGKRLPSRREPPVLLAHGTGSASGYSGSHAEVLYYQKQMQAQTVMVFVLEDGERIQGVIEWFDLHVIKVRHATRTMIYKSSIKYLFKAADVQVGSGAATRERRA